mgnify:CR=1 FL=1
MLQIFFSLLIAHAITDVFLQSERMEIRKTRKAGGEHWLYWMFAHSLLNGLGVWGATGIVSLGVIETIAHFLIDLGKSEGRYNVHVDQLLHLISKIGWTLSIYA